MLKIEKSLLKLNLQHILSHYGNGDRLERMAPLYTEMMARAAALMEPQYTYRLYPVERISDEAVYLQTGDTFTSTALAGSAAGADYLVLALYTIGDAVGQEISALFKRDDGVSAVILDSLATAYLDELGQHVYKCLEDEARQKGGVIGALCAPGVSDIKLEEQALLFKLLPENDIVRLTGSFLMSPLKSSSFMAGLGKNVAHDPYNGSQCAMCSFQDHCHYRQEMALPA